MRPTPATATPSLAARVARQTTVTVAATPTIQADLGSGLLGEFRQRYPHFPVRLLQGTADTDVDPSAALRLLDHADCADMRLTLVKGADLDFAVQFVNYR